MSPIQFRKLFKGTNECVQHSGFGTTDDNGFAVNYEDDMAEQGMKHDHDRSQNLTVSDCDSFIPSWPNKPVHVSHDATPDAHGTAHVKKGSHRVVTSETHMVTVTMGLST